MEQKKILNKLKELSQGGRKAFAVLIDPDKVSEASSLQKIIHMGMENKVDFFLVGGSLLTHDSFHQVIHWLKANSNIPVIIFPGNNMQIDHQADGLLFLSLISGRNPELLIGQHVVAAPLLKRSSVEVIPTGYILVDSGTATSVSYMSQTMPIPYDKPSLAACTAMAGEMLGMQLIYMDAGSGAAKPISQRMISSVRKSIDIPLFVGGGINSAEKAAWALEAGADVIVVGNGIEKDPNLLIEVSEKVNAYNFALNVHK